MPLLTGPLSVEIFWLRPRERHVDLGPLSSATNSEPPSAREHCVPVSAYRRLEAWPKTWGCLGGSSCLFTSSSAPRATSNPSLVRVQALRRWYRLCPAGYSVHPASYSAHPTSHAAHPDNYAVHQRVNVAQPRRQSLPVGSQIHRQTHLSPRCTP